MNTPTPTPKIKQSSTQIYVVHIDGKEIAVEAHSHSEASELASKLTKGK